MYKEKSKEMSKEIIRENLRLRGERLSSTEKRVFDYLLEEGRVVGVDEIVGIAYVMEIDELNKKSIITMIYRINEKIKGAGVQIKKKPKFGYYVTKYEEWEDFIRKKREKEEERKKKELTDKRKKRRGPYRKIERISESELIEIIRNLRKEK